MEMELKNEKRRSFWGGILLGVVITGIILTATFVVISVKSYRSYSDAVDKLSTELVSAREGYFEGKLIDSNTMKKAESIYSIINDDFLFSDDIDADKMRDNIYKGIVSSLGDVYTEYYTAEEYSALLEEVEGKYYGIGSYVSIDKEKDLVVLSGVFEGSGASEAGLRDGDYIYAVDDEIVAGWVLDDVVSLVKGEEGTTVKLTILRGSEYFDVDVTRKEVIARTVNHELKDNGIGYIQIREFDSVTSDQFEEAYTELQNAGMKALVLDLRSNPGGNLKTILTIARRILPKGLITYIEYRNGDREEYQCEGLTPIDIPLAVLVNGYSASASELLTGAIKDYGVGTIIGTTTFGKGIVQDFLSFKDGSGIKYTSSSYYTPSGVCIHKLGIEPDIKVEFEPEPYYNDGIDNQLNYALDFLKGKLSDGQ